MDVASYNWDKGGQLWAVTAFVSCSLSSAHREGARAPSGHLVEPHLDRVT